MKRRADRTFWQRPQRLAWDAENCDRCIKHGECGLCDAIMAYAWRRAIFMVAQAGSDLAALAPPRSHRVGETAFVIN